MNLDKIQVNACLRSGWQALDLGFLMARHWWRPLYFAGAVPPLIAFIPLLVFFFDNPFWAGFIIWWLKPFWERLPLYIASRRLFREEPGYRETVARARGLLVFDLLPYLLWRRLSLQRAFDAPVTVLEDLSGTSRAQRLRVLHGKYSDVAMGNQFACFWFELIVTLGLIILLVFFTPESISVEFFDSYENLVLLAQWAWIIAAFAAMTLIMPFHTMAGFALYLNRRIELEAWDIEISFRSLASRKRQASPGMAGMLAAMLLSAVAVFSQPAEAARQHSRDSAAELVEQVLAGESFGQEKTVRKWRFKNWLEDDEEDENIPDWLIEFFEWLEAGTGWWDGLTSAAGIIKLLLVVGFAMLLIYLLHRYRGPLGFAGRIKSGEAAPEIMFGLDVRPESLPRDVPAEALSLWRDGKHRESLSLLYRASLSHLLDRYEVAFRASHTEAECAALVAEQGIDSLSRYFNRLTSVWRRLAYGHELPRGEIVEALCQGWREEMRDEPV